MILFWHYSQCLSCIAVNLIVYCVCVCVCPHTSRQTRSLVTQHVHPPTTLEISLVLISSMEGRVALLHFGSSWPFQVGHRRLFPQWHTEPRLHISGLHGPSPPQSTADCVASAANCLHVLSGTRIPKPRNCLISKKHLNITSSFNLEVSD